MTDVAVDEKGNVSIYSQGAGAVLTYAPSQNENALYLCPSEGNEIYELKNGKITTKYSFDFGKYTLPDEYYQCGSLQELGEFIKDKTVIYKLAFQENKNYAILEGIRQTGFTAFSPFCGVLDRNTGTWKWFNFALDSFIFFRYLDDQHAYFMADPEMMKEIPGLTERFPLLNELSINDGVVIFKSGSKIINKK